ncbi:MAG: pitrilysin family protein [Pseudomonadota bacterium]
MIQVIRAFVFASVFAVPAQAATEISEVTSPGGIKAWLVQEPSIPFVSLELSFKGGGSLDREGARGAINLMVATLEEGAGDMDAQAFAKAREELAAGFGFGVGRDTATVTARFLSENRDEAIALLREALINPRFEQSAIDRVRAQVLTNLRSELTDPNSLASLEFMALAYGDHPYSSDLHGTLDSVAALTREDILNAYSDVFARDRVFVGAAGDISPEELGGILDTLLGDLPAEGASLPTAADVQVTGGITVLPLETPQSVSMFGHVGIPRDDPDFFPAFVANQIFGGSGLQSRLSTEVREERGLTYSVGSFLVNYDHAYMLMGSLASANDRIADAIDVVRAEWEKIAQQGVTQEELDSAKTYLTGAYPLRFDSNASIARILVGMQLDGLPKDYVNTRNDLVNAVTLEDVQRVAKRLYRAENLRFIIVGQPKGIENVN